MALTQSENFFVYLWLTSGLTNVRKWMWASSIIPFPFMYLRVHFCTLLVKTVWFSSIPVNVSWTWTVNPQPARLVLGIPVQTNPRCFWYFWGKRLKFSLWIYHHEIGTECFTGRFCCSPIQNLGRNFVTGTLQINPAV